MRQTAVLCLLAAASVWAAEPDGAAVYRERCATCHDQPEKSRAPARANLEKLTAEAAYISLINGVMAIEGAALSDAEKRAVSEFITGQRLGAARPVESSAGRCESSPAFDPARGPQWNGWGNATTQARFQPAAAARLNSADVPRLKLKWAFGFPGVNVAFGQPTVVGGRVFVGSANGKVYALDAQSGCTYWEHNVLGGARAAISIGPLDGGQRHAAYFGDLKANVHAVDAATGEAIWKVQVEEHPAARITGAPLLHAGRLYVPVSSLEELAAGNAKYECCRFRGSVVALDAASGKQLWKTFTIEEAPRPTRKNSAGTQMYGPAGGPVWSAPTLDLKRKAIYVATGNAYSDPESDKTDAVLALDMDTGKLLWSRQMTARDWWSFACLTPGRENCPEPAGPDFDFGNSPILHTLANGRRALTVGQKSGVVFSLDPDQKGELLWEHRVGRGSPLGGVQWGPAADDKAVYVAVSDALNPGPDGAGGLVALEPGAGKKLWQVPPRKAACAGNTQKGCTAAQSAAISAIPGVVFSGSIDGYMRAYSTADGSVLWEFDTKRDFETVNGVAARGGSIDSAGPTIVDGVLYTNSGYGMWFGLPGNVLLAFSVDGK